MGHRALVASLSRKIDETLAAIIPAGTPVALLGFPTQLNSGDHAIWLGETAWLGRNGNPVVLLGDRWTFPRPRAHRVLRGATILLHGGGNLGDLYPREQQFREEVLRSFPHNTIVQMPQTILFQDHEAVARARRAFEGHRHFTLLTRDGVSRDFARESFGCHIELCPDMALALGPIETSRPSREIVWVLRRDHESGLNVSREQTDRDDDWSGLVPGRSWRLRHAARRLAVDVLGVPVSARPRRFRRLEAALRGAFDPLARERVGNAQRIISSAEVMVTDRLHGHILGLLLGRPHVLLDSRFGKLSSFYETWTRASELTRFADSLAEAGEAAREIVADRERHAHGMPG